MILLDATAPADEYVLGPGRVEDSSPTRRILRGMTDERLTPLERKCIERAAERGQITPSSRTVARALNSTTAHVGRAVRDLRHRGLLEQHTGPSARLTPAGVELARSLAGDLGF